MRLFLFLILLCFSSPSLAEPNSSSVQDISSAEWAVWKIHNPNLLTLSGTVFFVSPYQFITSYRILSVLLKDSKLEDLVLSHKKRTPPLKIEKILALSAYHDLALLDLKTEKAIPHLNISENLSDANKNLVILGYPYGIWKQINKISEFLPPSNKLLSFFLVDHFNLPTISNEKNPVLDNKGQVSGLLTEPISSMSNIMGLSGASGSPVLDNKGQVVGVLTESLGPMSTIINLSSLKKFISGEERQNCNSNTKECMRRTLDSLKGKAEQGDVLAQYNLALMYFEEDRTKSGWYQFLNWMEIAAEQGFALAQFKMSYFYSKEKGKEPNFKEAHEWAERSAKQGYVPAQIRLAIMYQGKEGVKQDLEKAFRWMKEVAKQGEPLAQAVLARMYYEGIGTKQNREQALKWLEEAVQKGHPSIRLTLTYFRTRYKCYQTFNKIMGFILP